MKTGLILEGGAMRGLFTAGIIDVFLENGIVFDGTVGVSAGAAFGCNIKSKQIGRVIRYNTRFADDKRYCGISSLLKTGNLYSTEFCYNEVPLKHDVFDFDTFENNPMEFYVVCTDIESGNAVYHKYLGLNDHGFDWIRASASMPLVSQIVEIEEKKLLDGGVADSIPIRFFESIGYDKNVVVLTRPKGYKKEKNPLLPLVKVKYKKFPNLIRAMANRHNVYNETLDYIEKCENENKLFVFRPEEKLPVGKTEKNKEKMKEAYQLGRKAALDRLDELKKWLDS